MINQDLPRFIRLFTGICEMYQRNATEALIELYWRALQAYELSVVERAFNAHIHDPDYGGRMPLPADIVRYVEGSTSVQAAQAWDKVVSAMKHVGVWETVVFDDPIIHVVIADMGGWIALCQIKQDTLAFRAHEFAKRYGRYLIHKPTQYPNRLKGLVEQHNQQQGLTHSQVRLVGNKTLALQIWQSCQTAYHTVQYHSAQLSDNHQQSLEYHDEKHEK